MCMCTDPGCPCEGTCCNDATQTIHRVDMDDESGTPMCNTCADDAMETGLFVESSELKD